MRSFLALSLSLFTAASFAATQTTVGTTESKAPTATKRFALDLFAVGHSSAFANMNGRRATIDNSFGSPVTFTNQLTFSYKIFGDQALAVTPQIVFQPNQDQRVYLDRTYVGLQGPVFDTGKFSLWSRMETGVPSKNADFESGYITGPQWIAVFSYKPASRLEFQYIFVPSVNFYSNGTTDSYVYMSPRVYYSLNDSLKRVGLCEVHFGSIANKTALNVASARPSNLGAGVQYTLDNGNGIYFRPFVSIYPGSSNILETAHLGLHVGGPLL